MSSPSDLVCLGSHHPAAAEHMHWILLRRNWTGGHVPGAHLMCFDRQSIHRTRLALVWSDLILFHVHYSAFTDFHVSSLVSWLHGKIFWFSILLVSLYQMPKPLLVALFQLVFRSDKRFKVRSPIGKVKSQSHYQISQLSFNIIFHFVWRKVSSASWIAVLQLTSSA